MRKMQFVMRKSSFALIICILIVCLGFVIVSCGKGPQQKVLDFVAGLFAVDFTDCPAAPCTVILASEIFKNDINKQIQNKPLTIEAWVKNKATTTSSFTGGIFSRLDANGGIALFAKGGIVKAAIRRVVATGTATATADYIVTSGVSLIRNVWHHVAAVLSNTPHSHPSNDCNANDADDDIHLDIYVNGQFEGCAATFGASNDPATQPDFADEPFGINVTAGVVNTGDDKLDSTIDSTVQFLGVVDELRLWGVARSQDQIDKCRFQELSLDGGDCGRMRSDLISYMRLNEGKGETVNDWTGLGSGAKEDANAKGWLSGWTSGVSQLSPRD